jgi:exodeoxyribonuclease VII small subunit
MSRQDKSIEEKTTELTKLVSWFDSEEFTIEKALEKFKEAEKLATEIEQDLSALKNEIEIVKKRFDSE